MCCNCTLRIYCLEGHRQQRASPRIHRTKEFQHNKESPQTPRICVPISSSADMAVRKEIWIPAMCTWWRNDFSERGAIIISMRFLAGELILRLLKKCITNHAIDCILEWAGQLGSNQEYSHCSVQITTAFFIGGNIIKCLRWFTCLRTIPDIEKIIWLTSTDIPV
jgi:hypothetical protein